jgi:hypothetical protein
MQKLITKAALGIAVREKHPDAITGFFALCMTRRGQLVDGHPLAGGRSPPERKT